MASVIHENLNSYQPNYDPNFLSEDEEEYCPLCIEPLDITDKNFFPCPCGYQICQFCYNNIRQNPELNGRCPACRRKYDDESVRYKVLSPEELKLETAKLARREKERKQREKEKKDIEYNNRKHLAGMRVIQKNLVYVIGVNPPVPFEDVGNTLKSEKYFGQYGKINKIVVNKKNSHGGNDNYHGHHSPGYGVYITFASKDDAAKCIAQVDGTYMDGRLIKAAYGTTKYCSSYLRGLPCPNPNCMFLHEPGEEADSFNRRELHNKQQLSHPQNTVGGISGSTPSSSSSNTATHNVFKSNTATNGAHSSTNANNNSSFNPSSTNSPLSIKTHLHGHDAGNNTSTSTPVLTPAPIPTGANPWGISQSSTPITTLNLSKNMSSNNIPTLGELHNDTLHNNSHSNIAATFGLSNLNKGINTNNTTTANGNNGSTRENNKKKNNNNAPEKKYVDPYDSSRTAVEFLDSTIQFLSNYENHEIKFKDNLIDDEEYSKYPSLFSWNNIKTSEKSEYILRDKLIGILATKPVDYSASVIQFLQSVGASGVVPITALPNSVSNNPNPTSPSFQNNENLLNDQGLTNKNVLLQLQQQQGLSTATPPPPPGIYPMNQMQQVQQKQPQKGQRQGHDSNQLPHMHETGITNSTDLLNQLIKGRKITTSN